MEHGIEGGKIETVYTTVNRHMLDNEINRGGQ
ncbi:MAG: hypothetical protein AVDCRST_MAG87-218 [uncultured Thermomicrobiales bacterium]|uniref:Uncharacterized protein n=1 Tax=uncultured Thermomicrobiales bacterium TaxID=1645740 RepID=A0A6J4U7R3_9BACT|nr:MAG: hypothetical protein AVDCRST_MAG87-218 [uncultured Thermomicrobiales bacterium]